MLGGGPFGLSVPGGPCVKAAALVGPCGAGDPTVQGPPAEASGELNLGGLNPGRMRGGFPRCESRRTVKLATYHDTVASNSEDAHQVGVTLTALEHTVKGPGGRL